VRDGFATLDALTRGGAKQISPSPSCVPAFPSASARDWPAPLYAASVEGALPTACATWVDAERACAYSGKRLLTDDEWQRAAAGTPDGVPCFVYNGVAGPTGTWGCVSKLGLYDMVGNVWEWVVDASLGDEETSDVGLSGANSTPMVSPAWIRGGHYDDDTSPGVFAVNAPNDPSVRSSSVGFRCVR
jgi:formylglycine-generating enzyme required for sulfatase activity